MYLLSESNHLLGDGLAGLLMVVLQLQVDS